VHIQSSAIIIVAVTVGKCSVTSADLGGSGRMERSLRIRSPTPYVESTPGSPLLLAVKLLAANFLRREEATAGTPPEEAVVMRLEPWRRRSGGGGTPARPRGVERARRGRGLLPDVCRPGAIPRGYCAHPGRKPPRSGLPKAHAGLRGGEFRVGCWRGESTGIPAGK